MARPNVPQFGNWEGDSNTPYTVYFEKARQTRGGKMINPNDPEENPDMFPNLAPSAAPAPPSKPKTQTEELNVRGVVSKQTNERRVSKEDGDFRQYANSPARNENVGRRVSNEQPPHQVRQGGGRGGSNSGKTGRQSAGSDHSIEKSPLHPHYQAKAAGTGRGAASPAWEGKNAHDSSHGTPGRSFESSHATPGRSRMKQESQPDRGAAVPRFGEWNENDPQSADNYTHIFNKVREERQVDSGNVSGTPSRSNNTQRYLSDEKQKKCCFGWW